jgi:cytochrome P450
MSNRSQTVTNAVVNRRTPGPGIFRSMKSGLHFVRDPFAVLEQADKQYGPIVRFEMGSNRVVHLIHRPEHVQHVLLDNNRNYHKYTPYSLLKGLFGRGLLFNEGKSWFSQRRLLQPAFQPGHFSTLADGIGQAVVSVVDQWPRTESGQQTDIEVEMSRLSRRVVGQVLFGTDLSDDLHDVLQVDGSKLNFLLGNVPLMPQNRRLQAGMRRLDKAVYAIIAERRSQSQSQSAPDILNALLNAVDKDSGETMSDKQLRDEIVTLLFSGFDTTSRTLTWVFHALSQNPKVEAKLHQELHDVLGNRKATYADISKLAYTEMLVKETMRMFPANAIIGRQAKEDDEIGGYHIPAGSCITLCQYLAHRDPSVWENAAAFEPERFAPGQELPHRFAYFPFGGGPRQCIGKGLAMMTIPMAVATIAQQYRFAAMPNFKVEHDIKVTFQSRRGIRATRHLRPAFNSATQD